MGERPHCDLSQVAAWFAGRVPDNWFNGPLDVRCDRDEILVIGPLAEPVHGPDDEQAREVAAEARISGFREDTRKARMSIAGAAEHRWQRHVAWGVSCGPLERVFTHASVPVMTRLRFAERQVLDTLIDAGVARSRSEAMAWCVTQVGEHQAEWIDRLRDAIVEVERIRNEGP
jgi:hypothetical protein